MWIGDEMGIVDASALGDDVFMLIYDRDAERRNNLVQENRMPGVPAAHHMR